MSEWVIPDFLPVLGSTPVEGYVLAAGACGNGVIKAPSTGRDLADFIMTGSMSWYLDHLPLSRFAKLKYDENGY
jgi:sarcosine oxidase subunit beta